MTRARSYALAGACLAGASAVAAGCFTGSDGLVPPTESLYFPTALALSPGRTSLYVANSDFDLQYNGGTVQVINVADVEGQLGTRSLAAAVADTLASDGSPEQACSAIGSTPNADDFLYPGTCAPIAYTPFVRKFVTVGAFTSAMTLLPRQDGSGLRLFAAVRGDPSVTYFDVVDDRDPSAPVSPCGEAFCLECGASGDDRRCNVGHRIGESAVSSLRGLTMPTEPSGIAAAPIVAGDALVVPHQTEDAASLIVNRWAAAAALPWPTLEFTLRDLDTGPTSVVTIPPPQLVRAAQATITYRPGFVISHNTAPVLSVIRYEDDEGSSPPRPFLVRGGTTLVTLQGEGSDTRGMAIDSTERDACEALTDPTDIDGLRRCVEDFPLRFYAATRTPSALMVGTIESTVASTDGIVTSVDERVSLDEIVPLPIGPSGVSLGNVINLQGELEPRVFIVSFDSRYITVYDPRLRRVETSTIRTGRGPFGMAFDTGLDQTGALRSHLYVGNFTDSYISVIDLDMGRKTYGTVLVSLGPPTPPREEQ